MTRLTISGALAVTLLASPALGQLRVDLVASGLANPVAFVQDPSNPNVQYVVEQAGHIRVLVNGVLQQQDFLNISTQIGCCGERGLLGMAMPPDYGTTGRFWLNFTNPDGHTVIARFLRSANNPLVADVSSRVDLTWPIAGTSSRQGFITQPFANHNGGNILFGPDGYLYIGMGDGGAGDDPQHLAQNPQSLLGKMLRVDVRVSVNDAEGYDIPGTNPYVNIAGVMTEIWDFGLRNPWRFSFDDPSKGGTGALVIGDVGQGQFEEVDYEPALRGGRNYGWRNREGAHDHVVNLPPFSVPLTDPIVEYSHAQGASITGGYVYRGTALGAAYRGRYFFADFSFSKLWSVALAIDGQTGEATASDLQDHSALLAAPANLPSSFGVDAQGELYILAYSSGRIYRLALTSTTPAGCPPPDPFAILGGGTCFNGAWYPPGYPIPGQAPAPTPTQTPTPTPTSTPPPTGCATPDPFAALGGGTCVNGAWYPPGYPIPGQTPAPTPTPTTTPTPTPTPPPTGNCASPDPFAALGGGTCFNGAWYPPGYPIPGQTPAPTPTPTPTPTPIGCQGPDPFVILGGGTCVNGNWLPPGYPTGPSSLGNPWPDPVIIVPDEVGSAPAGPPEPEPQFETSGVVQFFENDGGFFAIQSDDGTVYEVSGEVPASFAQDGLRVRFVGKFLKNEPVIHGLGPVIDLVIIVR